LIREMGVPQAGHGVGKGELRGGGIEGDLEGEEGGRRERRE
jgi:hypothetical protein